MSMVSHRWPCSCIIFIFNEYLSTRSYNNKHCESRRKVDQIIECSNSVNGICCRYYISSIILQVEVIKSQAVNYTSAGYWSEHYYKSDFLSAGGKQLYCE